MMFYERVCELIPDWEGNGNKGWKGDKASFDLKGK